MNVFVSYSHMDSDVAERLCKTFVSEGLSIVVDSGALAPGRSIEDFIREGVRNTDATVSLVSKYSLLSAWVALESEEVLRDQRKAFFGCYIDESFLRRGFVDEALEYAESQTSEIGQLIKKRIDAGRRFEDLYADLRRYEVLRSNIAKVVNRLRETKCLSLHPDAFDRNVALLVQTLKSLKG